MTLVVRLSAVCMAMLSASLGVASDDSDFGEFTTRVAEDRLFVQNGRVLRCDLFFTAAGRETVVAPKGSELKQSLPPVVWQYSGLLPVSDYLKTAVIHSVSSEQKELPWQDVQRNFYDGLRVEGVSELDAKIAYAGAYAFASRWPLAELIQVDEPEPVYQDTILYKVEYTKPAPASMEVDEYRDLALQIFQKTGEVSLQAIRGVVDAADSIEAKSMERASLGGIGTFGGVKLTGADDALVLSAAGTQDTAAAPQKAPESASSAVPENAQETVAAAVPVENVEIHVELVEPVELVEKSNNIFSPEQLEGPIKEDRVLNAVTNDSATAVGGIVTGGGSLKLSSGQVVTGEGSSDAQPHSLLPAADDIGISDDEWILQPDGTLVLRSVRNPVTE